MANVLPIGTASNKPDEGHFTVPAGSRVIASMTQRESGPITSGGYIELQLQVTGGAWINQGRLTSACPSLVVNGGNEGTSWRAFRGSCGYAIGADAC